MKTALLIDALEVAHALKSRNASERGNSPPHSKQMTRQSVAIICKQGNDVEMTSAFLLVSFEAFGDNKATVDEEQGEGEYGLSDIAHGVILQMS